MKESKAYIRSVFCLFLVTLILFASYSSTEYVDDNNTPKKEQKEQQNNNETEKKAEIREFSVEAILPIINFPAPLLYASSITFPQTEFLIEGDLYLDIRPLSTHFRKLFTCIISVNAP